MAYIQSLDILIICSFDLDIEVDVNRAINGYQRTDSVKQAVRSYNVIEKNAWLFDRNWPVLRICDIKAVFLH